MRDVVLGAAAIGVVVNSLLLVAVLRMLARGATGSALAAPTAAAGPELLTKVSEAGLEVSDATVVVFLAPGCEPCHALLPDLGRMVREQLADVVPVMPHAEQPEIDHFVRTVGVAPRLDLNHLYEDWKIPGTPYAVGISRGGEVVAARVANDFDQLSFIADRARERDEAATAVAINWEDR